MSALKCILLAGLGNPGPEYSQTRHNIGFLVVDALAQRLGRSLDKSRFDAEFTRAPYRGRDIFLVKPMSYMNRSGLPIQRLAAYYKIEMEDILVVHDDMDLEFGRVMISKGRGHGGHNGIRSIIDAFGRKDCVRVRVGVGHPDNKKNVTGHVLGRFTPDEQSALDALIQTSADACFNIIENGATAAMNQVNSQK